jgi:hypothetical protein
MTEPSIRLLLDQHFHGRSPEVRRIYDAILAAARKLGHVEEEPKKDSIHLVNRTAFAGVQTRREHLILTVKSQQDISSSRVFKREQASANRWHLEVKLHSQKDVDAELKKWLKQAYQISG